MSVRVAEDARMMLRMEKIQKYGASGGTENRGILTDIKAADLPDESLMDFCSAPYEFEETALWVKEDLQRLYYHAGTANRFSEKYLKYLPQLESFIKQAGSYCLTKAVLEQKGYQFPKLADRTIPDLVQMVSFHIRKCHAAIEGLYRDNNMLGFVYLRWELRLIRLGERLKATGVKIQKIIEGRLGADDLMERQETFRGKARSNENGSGLSKSLSIRRHCRWTTPWLRICCGKRSSSISSSGNMNGWKGRCCALWGLNLTNQFRSL